MQIQVQGMSCQHCVKAVTTALEDLGLKDVVVNLESGTATFADTTVDAATIRKAIEEEGFTIVG